MKPATLFSLAALVAIPAGVAWSADAAADKPSDKAAISERWFGDVRFVMGGSNATRWLEMHVDRNLVAAFRDFAADEVVASPDRKHFLALSNSAKSSYAFAILDRKGEIEASSAHGGDLHYCERTAWGVGEWVDTKQPQATFSIQKNELTSPATEFLFATVRGCDGTTVILARALPPPLKATPAAGNATVDTAATGIDRNSFFIGNTIKNLRDLDPTFGGRTLTMVDGRRMAATTFQYAELPLPATWTDPPVSERRSCRGPNDCSSADLVIYRAANGSMQVLAAGLAGGFIALPRSHKVFACAESNGAVESKNPAPAIVDLNGNSTSLPSHPGLLRICARAGTGDEVLMVYTMAQAGRAYTLARVFDGSGALLAEKNFDRAGTVEFSVAGRQYSEDVPGP